MMPRGYFVAGTDTDVGKTYVTCGLINGFGRLGIRAGGMKPVFCGSIADDIDNIAAVSGYSAGMNSVCTYRLPHPIAPSIAAQREGKCIEIAPIVVDFTFLSGLSAMMIVEGTGGWLCPISQRETMADVAGALGLPVVLVVGLRLGCLNHALLSAAAIRQSGLPLAGWIANAIDTHFTDAADNIDFLEQRLDAPLLANLPHAPQPSARELCLAPAAQLLNR